MYLQIDKSGANYWRLNYRFAGKEKTLALGVYPEVSRAAALGRRPIADIDTPMILTILKRIDGRGARFTAHRVGSEISRVCRFAIKEG